MKVQNFSYYIPVKVVFGEGKLQKVGSLTKELGKKAFFWLQEENP